MRSAEFYRQQADEMLERAALATRLESVSDNFDDGTVVRFTKPMLRMSDANTFVAVSHDTLTYVAVRVTTVRGHVRWYVSGTMTTARGGYSWVDLLDFIGVDSLDTVELLEHRSLLFATHKLSKKTA